MKDQRKTEIKVGVTVIVGILILLWVFGWAKNLTIGAEKKELSVIFSSVAGLEIGDPVTINGVRKGYVKDIAIENDVVVTKLNLDKEVSLRKDSKFSVMMLDLMGGKKIEVHPGTAPEDIDYSKMQNGEFVGDIASAMAMLSSVQYDLVDVIKEVKISLASVNKTLTDQQFNNDLKSSVTNLVQLTENLNSLIQANSGEINKLLKTGNELAVNVNSFIVSNKDTITNTLSAVQDVLKESKLMLSKANTLIDQTNNSENNLGKILYDPKLLTDIKESISHVKELTRILVEQLKGKGIEVNAHIF
ncbi:MAG: organic solvents resistance ABC transporter periplasmic protein [Ignavibacteria bacterium]|nr:MAG: organic solvents resistance ABC transporter periplasmic protein [Ignavibacteria bacterium]KAF0162110.1 MAG: organic solvents resistance ABC transporter periplasmic protein [Ignavibacteria bacterium]